MSESKNSLKTVLRKIWVFFCTKIPVISLIGIALCWVIYLLYPREGNISSYPHSYWVAMGVIVWLTMIFGALFLISLIAYLFYRPLSDKLKWLRILVRVLIAVAAVIVTVFGVYISLFIFAALGY